MEAVECGAAALGIVLAYHGRWVPLAELREAAAVSRDGSNAANVVRAARRYGMSARGLAAEVEDLGSLAPPFIVFWKFNHFVVVEGIVGDRVRLNDPAGGRRLVSADEFDAGFTGVVLELVPGESFEKGGQAPSAIRGLRTRLGGVRRDLAFCIAAGLLLVFPGIALPMLKQAFIDGVFIQDRGDWTRPLLIGLAGVGLIQLILAWMQLGYLRALRARLAVRMASGFLDHVLRLPAGFFAQRFTGEIAGRVALNDGIADILSGRLAAAAIDCVTLVLYGAVMLQYDAWLTVIGVGAASANVLLLRWIANRRVESSLRARHEMGRLAGVTTAGLQSIETLKASALEASFFGRWAGHYARAASARQELEQTQQSLAVAPGLLAALGAAAVLVIGGFRVISGELTIGALIAFQSLMVSFQRPVGTLVSLAGDLQALHGDLSRVDDVLDHKRDLRAVPPGLDDRAAEAGRLVGLVELRGVTFGYSRAAPPLIEGLDLRIEPGTRVALVGGSGSGKSTVARLLAGLFEPWDGEILIDGLPRGSLDRRRLARSLAFVDQDLAFFSGSIRNNLTLWDPTVPDVDIEEACRDAEILDELRRIPGGFDGSLLEGAANLSGGQRQRLEIARALVGRPSILILDEATSALDSETERRIDLNLRRRGCTSLLVAHRLSTIRDAGEIVVLRGGKVVERGRHDGLWQSGGEYRRLLETGGEG